LNYRTSRDADPARNLSPKLAVAPILNLCITWTMRLRIMILDSFWGFSRSRITMEPMIHPKKIIWTLYGSSWDHVIIKYRDKKADKLSKNVLRKILMMSSDRKIIRRNRSGNRNIWSHIDHSQIIINRDVKSRVCAGSSARIIVYYILGFWRCQIWWSCFLTSIKIRYSMIRFKKYIHITSKINNRYTLLRS